MIIKSDSIILTKDINKLSLINPKLYMPKKWYWYKKEVVKYNNDYYYMKKVSDKELINELIGSILSKIINLNSIEYEIAMDEAYNFYVMSKLFYDKEKKYYKPYEFGYTTYHIFDINIKDYNVLSFVKELSPQLLSDFLKLIALDIKMLQTDRNATNITFEKDKLDNYRLSPAYDYEEAYTNNFDMYFNPFVILWMTPKYLKEFVSSYEETLIYLNILKNINIEDILSEISRIYKISFSKEESDFYKEKDTLINKLLLKI